MRFAPLLCFAAFAGTAGITTPAAAHDAPLAFVEAMEAHLLDCPAVNGFAPEGQMLSSGWAPRQVEDAILEQHAADFKTDGSVITASSNIYAKTVEGLELIQFMAIRSIADPDGDPSANDGRGEIAATEYLCVTMAPDLPFMPSGRLLGAVFGKDADAGIGNSPGNLRDGTWVWNARPDTHVRTIARYTNSFSEEAELPDDVFYPGFYMLSFRQFTPEQNNSNQAEESE